MTSAEIETFIGKFRSLVIASLTPEGDPYASSAAFIRHQNDFYCLLSTVAQHGRNLLHSPKVSLIFAEDEAVTDNPFARKRVTVSAEAMQISRNEPEYTEVIQKMGETFDPNLIAMLSSMGDFHLFQIKPFEGSAVEGFGKAYRLNEKLEIEGSIVRHHQKENHG